MGDPRRVDWTIDDGPSCGDCVHSWFEYADVRDPKFRLCRVARNETGRRWRTAAWCKSERRSSVNEKGEQSCGPGARYFERRVPEVPDFENNPPLPGAWR